MHIRTVLPLFVCLFLLPRFAAAQSAPRDTMEVNRVMEAFYAHWLDNGMSIPDAFRAAQAVAKAGNANPLYWAGFVLVE